MDRAKVAAAIDNLMTGFNWRATSQGHDYWKKVKNNLQAMIDESTYEEL